MQAAQFANAYIRIIMTRSIGEMALNPLTALSPCMIIIVKELSKIP